MTPRKVAKRTDGSRLKSSLNNNDHITQHAPKSVSYIHLMCEQHELVLSNGIWTESFQPGTQALLGVESEQRDELFTIFPELRNETARNLYHSARISLKAWESRVAINAMVWL
ncbi:Hint domain-containing protein [Planktotalea sp.]|uniref:Hint domain-containing protein n=1 Tax=Planktotalea sp. TaxID=2029877 RepID=UPI00344ED77F